MRKEDSEASKAPDYSPVHCVGHVDTTTALDDGEL
ncbi:hypothetical protein CGMCC3_g12816 [Colletotrichum fructicola]|nr:uncharacterized protein CGMCC3_g12816 [Colletotrichum fructicola]KAE9571109.1 hypothetical protein CGMCC3_g12816 [Colletotrichum fructicola]